MEENKYINRQISVYKTSRRLIEFIDKLKPASVYNYAKIHSGTDEKWNGHKLISCVGVRIGDYSVKPAQYSEANISPDDVRILYSLAYKNYLGKPKSMTYLREEKIMPVTGENGRSKVTKLTIVRQEKDSKDRIRRLPVVIAIEDGTGILKKTATGGNCCASGSYQRENMHFINMSDKDFYIQLSHVNQFLNAWELTNEALLIREARKKKEETIHAS